MDSYPSASGVSFPDHEATEAANKFRIRFQKIGDMRFISHHDLMHCVERLFRRAQISLQMSQGFHPKPRIVFPLSLALGVAGRDEVLEVATEEPLAAPELLGRLAAHCIAGLNMLSARPLPPRSSGRVTFVGYRLPLSPDAETDVVYRIAKLLGEKEWWVERLRPNPRMVDLRPAIRRLEIVGGALEMELWVLANGTPRPREILDLLNLNEFLHDGAVLERTNVELADEQSSPLAPPCQELPVRKVTKKQTQASSETLSDAKKSNLPESLISGPLSFNS